MSDIRTQLVIAVLNIGTWLQRKTDKPMKQELIDNHNLSENAVNVTKHLFPQKPKEMLAIQTHAERLRDIHTQNTLPWLEGGNGRILPVGNLLNYNTLMDAGCAEFEQLVTNLEPKYAQFVLDSKAFLGSKWNFADYPADVRSKYYVRRHILPVPYGDDFRLIESSEPVDYEALYQSVESEFANSIKESVLDLYLQLAEAVKEIANRMAADNQGMRQSSVRKMQEAIKRIEVLNITNDPVLTMMADKIAGSLEGWTAKDLNNMPDIKVALASEFQEIAQDLERNANHA